MLQQSLRVKISALTVMLRVFVGGLNRKYRTTGSLTGGDQQLWFLAGQVLPFGLSLVLLTPWEKKKKSESLLNACFERVTLCNVRCVSYRRNFRRIELILNGPPSFGQKRI